MWLYTSPRPYCLCSWVAYNYIINIYIYIFVKQHPLNQIITLSIKQRNYASLRWIAFPPPKAGVVRTQAVYWAGPDRTVTTGLRRAGLRRTHRWKCAITKPHCWDPPQACSAAPPAGRTPHQQAQRGRLAERMCCAVFQAPNYKAECVLTSRPPDEEEERPNLSPSLLLGFTGTWQDAPDFSLLTPSGHRPRKGRRGAYFFFHCSLNNCLIIRQ